jgi:hypothetical protein
MTGLKEDYKKIIEQLSKVQIFNANYSQFSYTSDIQKSIRNLYDSAKYTIQIVGLRLASLGEYIRIMNELKTLIENARYVNAEPGTKVVARF